MLVAKCRFFKNISGDHPLWKSLNHVPKIYQSRPRTSTLSLHSHVRMLDTPWTRVCTGQQTDRTKGVSKGSWRDIQCGPITFRLTQCWLKPSPEGRHISTSDWLIWVTTLMWSICVDRGRSKLVKVFQSLFTGHLHEVVSLGERICLHGRR